MSTKIFFRKTLLVACCLLTLSAGSFAAETFTISDKLLQTFKQTFPDAIQVKWVEQADKYSVSFKQNDILTKVDYDKDGNFVSSLRYYTEKNLPVTVICRLQKKYAGKTVFGVTEVATDATTEYYIKLEDAKSWTTVKSDADGNMQVVEKYKKAD
jgi:hypothetical protein